MVSNRRLRALAAGLILVGLVGSAWATRSMRRWSEPLAHATGGESILCLELAGWSPGRAAETIEGWRPVKDLSCAARGVNRDVPLTECGRRIQELDRLFIPAYVSLLGGLALLVGTWLEAGARRRWRWLVALAPAAGLLDFLENSLMNPWLEPTASAVSGTVALWVAAVASLKFALLVIVSLASCVVGLVAVRSRISRRRLPV